MAKLDYIHIAQSLESGDKPSIPQEEQDVFSEIWESAAEYPTQFDTSAVLDRIRTEIDPPVLSVTRGSKVRRWVAAAAVLISLGVGYVFFANGDKSYYAHEGEQKNIQLNDQSSVLLDGGTRITIDGSFNEDNRNLKLNGVAFFDVAKNTELPFIIQTSKGSIQVLGTSFAVHANGETERFAIDVFEGRVQVKTIGDKQILTRGMHAELLANGKLDVKANSVSSEYISGEFNFINTRIKDIVIEVENHFGVEVQYDNQLAEDRITLRSKASSANEILTVISATVGSNFSIKE